MIDQTSPPLLHHSHFIQ